jgi:hypothetical protein
MFFRRLRFLALLAVALLGFMIAAAPPCLGAEDSALQAGAQFREVFIRAGELEYDEAADMVTATGGVQAQFQASPALLLRTPAAAYRPEAGVLEATQGITISYGDDNPVIVTGDTLRYERDSGLMSLEGNVAAAREEFRITAQSIILERASNTFSAPGPVTIMHGEDAVLGRDLAFDASTGQGTMLDAYGCYRGVNIKGESVTFSTAAVTFHRAVASTCDINGSKDYRIQARSVTVTPDNKAHFKRLELYVKNTRVFGWKSYTMAFGDSGGPRTEPGRAAGAVRVKPPSLGYNDAGGVFGRTGLTYDSGPKSQIDLNTHYYINNGFFSQIEANRMRGGTRMYAKAGKEYKENTGYFRYMSPVIVWNQPTVGVDFGRRVVRGTRLSYAFSAEAGRLKEKLIGTVKDRAFGKLYARYPLTPGRKVVFSLVGDARYGFYSGSREYRVAGAGAGLNYVRGGNAKHTVDLQYLHFDENGRTYFVSDAVDTNDKIYFGVSAKATQKTRLRVDGEFDLDDSRFDEVEYMLSRTYECVTLDLGYRKELKSILFRVNILGFDRNRARGAAVQSASPESEAPRD